MRYYRPRIKICGLRTVEQVQMVASHGVDALGFVLYDKSPRYVDFAMAKILRQATPAFVSTVCLLVNPTQEQVQTCIKEVCPSFLQFHGDESAEFCEQFSYPYIRAIRVAEGMTAKEVHALASQYKNASGFLLDKWSEAYGGTGELFNHSILPELLAQKSSIPWIIAGGINVNNVAQLIQQYQPYGIDLSSAVERAKGEKCPEKVAAFMQAVRQAQRI